LELYLDPEQQEHAKRVIEEASKKMLVIASNFINDLTLPVEEVTPFVLHWLYYSAATYIRINRVVQTEESTFALKILKQALQKLDTRWKVAGQIHFHSPISQLRTESSYIHRSISADTKST
jgi:hypothetical protein